MTQGATGAGATGAGASEPAATGPGATEPAAGVPLPPSVRSRAALRLTAAAAVGRFELQVCQNCGAVQYPPREACHRCLSSSLRWELQTGDAELLSETTLLHSHDEYFRARLPVRLGLVKLDVGPTAVVYLGEGVDPPPCRVRVGARLDKSGQGVLVAMPERPCASGGAVAQSAYLREMSCDPRGHRVLVVDAGSALGVALVRELVDAGAGVVWAGCSAATAERGGVGDLFRGLEQVQLVAIDAMSEASVKALAEQIGAQVDILINNLPASDAPLAFGSAMRAAAAAAPVGSPMLAWVGFSRESLPAATSAAAYASLLSLRAAMQPAGVRVLNVFAGPLDEAGSETGLARAVVKALREGIEDLYPAGALPQGWLARWCSNWEELECGVAAEQGLRQNRG